MATGKSDAPTQQAQAPLEAAWARSTVAFVGTVVSVGAPPPHWAGRIPMYQEVRYRLDESLKGHVSGPEVVVRHVVVAHSPTAQPGDVPGLSSKLFAPGTKLLVLLTGKTDQGGLVSLEERLGAQPATAELLTRVRTLAK